MPWATGEILDWFLKRDIDSHIPIKDMSRRKDGTFSREDFVFDAERDVYICPGGKTLTTTGRVFVGNTPRLFGFLNQDDREGKGAGRVSRMPSGSFGE